MKPDHQLTIEWQLDCRRSKPAAAPAPVRLGRLPRVTRLLALAIKFQDLIDRGAVRDYADLARLGFVTRARLTQIMNLLRLAPDIQEQVLFLPRHEARHDPVTERDLRPLAAVTLWHRQRRLWRQMHAAGGKLACVAAVPEP